MKNGFLITRVLTAAMFVALLSGCEGRKQKAAAAIDAAHLSIADARKAGAETVVKAQLAAALSALDSAEERFKAKDYPEAEQIAERARDAAQFAESNAKAAQSAEHGRKKAPAARAAKASKVRK